VAWEVGSGRSACPGCHERDGVGGMGLIIRWRGGGRGDQHSLTEGQLERTFGGGSRGNREVCHGCHRMKVDRKAMLADPNTVSHDREPRQQEADHRVPSPGAGECVCEGMHGVPEWIPLRDGSTWRGTGSWTEMGHEHTSTGHVRTRKESELVPVEAHDLMPYPRRQRPQRARIRFPVSVPNPSVIRVHRAWVR